MQIQNRLAHLDDNASGIPGRELGKLLYGRDSVFARNPTPDQVHFDPRLTRVGRRCSLPAQAAQACSVP